MKYVVWLLRGGGLVLLLHPKEDYYVNKVARFGILAQEESSLNLVKKNYILRHLLETILQLLNTRMNDVPRSTVNTNGGTEN